MHEYTYSVHTSICMVGSYGTTGMYGIVVA
jgi:hypothetical protein